MTTRKNLKTIRSAMGMPAILCAVTVVMVVAIECRHPYFFLQDDNRVYNLPAFVHNFRAVTGGEFPLFNFHQYLGVPVGIQSNALYPLNYVALGLSQLLLGNFFGTMEIIALFHLTIAALGFYYLMRHFELEEVCCCFGAIAWTFCSFVITVGNSWIQILGYAAYLPWILLFSLKQMYRFDITGFIVLVFLRVAALFVGNTQFFLYTVTFDALTVLLVYAIVVKGEGRNRRQGGLPFLLRYFSNYLVVFLISLPLVLPASREIAVSASRKQALSWSEYSAFAYDINYWLNGIFTPFVDAGFNSWSEQQFISHIGYLPLVFILAALGFFRNYRHRKYIAVFSIMAVISFLWATNILITPLMYHLPIFNRFTLPFKLAFFTSFYLVALSTFGASIFYNKINDSKRFGHRIAATAFAVIMVLHVGNFLFLYVMSPQHVFARHMDGIPFDEPLKDKLGNGRIVSAGLDVVWDGEKALPGFSAPLLGYNYASLWGLYHFGGYGALIPERNLNAALGVKNSAAFEVAPGVSLDFTTDVPLEYFRKWGVAWYVIDKRIPLSVGKGLRISSSDAVRNVVFDGAAQPFAYWADGKASSEVTYEFRTNSMKVTTDRSSDGKLVLNVLYNPQFTASMDGKSVPVTETEDAQILINVPGGGHTLVLRYTDRLFTCGAAISLTVATLLVVLYGIAIMSARGKRGREEVSGSATSNS